MALPEERRRWLRTHFLWPENAASWTAFLELQTQWRMGAMGGATGLDYAGVRAWLDEEVGDGGQRRELWADIRACERAALAQWAETRRRRSEAGIGRGRGARR